MPRLDDARLTVSIARHTVRVDGLVPRGFTGTLPFYAVADELDASGRTRVDVVYPIATVNPNGVTEDGQPTRNPEPFTYAVCGGETYHPSNDIGAFGGFPFVEYVCDHVDRDGRRRGGIAFHGPITTTEAEGSTYWSLLRGPVSHACNRMLGEHVLELAHLIGFDRGAMGTPVQVVAGLDTWHGRVVDVDYGATGWTRPSAAASLVFPTWQAVQATGGGVRPAFPQWACESTRCDAMPASSIDAETGGLPRAAIECPPAYHAQAIGARGGVLCVGDDGRDAWGPFTKAMIAACRPGGGGDVCLTDRWEASFTKGLRGDAACPVGARYDALTGYCAEGDDAFGPFPSAIVAKCIGAGGGETACRSARWSRLFLASILGRL